MSHFLVRNRKYRGTNALGRQGRLGLELLESRLVPAVTAVENAGLLTVSYGAVGDAASLTGTATTGSAITVVGTGFAATPFAGVSSITVTGIAGTGQSLILNTAVAADALLAPGGALTVSGIATTTVNGFVNVGTGGSITGDAPTVVVQNGNGATIQSGIELTGVGGTVTINNGTYDESNILVPRAVTITGQSQAGVLVAPAFADSHDDSGFGGTPSSGFVVQSSNVTIQSLTLDGNGNAGLAGTANFRNGIITDFTAPSRPFNNLTVQNVTVQNVFHAGIEVATPGTGNQIRNDVVTRATNPNGDATGIALFGTATVTGNTVSNSDNGIGSNLGNGSVLYPVVTVQGNTLSNDVTGFNLASLATGSLIGGAGAGNANTITMNGSGEVGILLSFSNGTTTIQGNQITGSASDAGIWLENNPAGAGTLIMGNSLTSTSSSATTAGTGVGIFLFDDPAIVNEVGSPLSPVVATLQTNTITGFTRGIDLEQTYATSPQSLTATLDGNTLTNDATGVRLVQSNAGATVTATFQNTNSITGGTTGLSVSGSGVTLTNNTLASAAFAGQSGLYIDLESGALAGATLDATGTSFAGNTGAAATIQQNLAVEAKLHHAIDSPALGFVRILPGNVFVTTTGSKTIANALAIAVAGNTVTIGAGTYAEAINDTKGLNFQVAAPDNVVINSLTGGGNSTVTLNGAGATLTTGDATSTTYGGTIAGAGNLVKQGAGTFTLTGNDTYAGTTAVNGGTLVVNGTLAAGGVVSVNNGGTLTGTGTIQRQLAVNSGGTLTPGSGGTGTLPVAGVTFQSGSTFNETVNGPTAGTNSNELIVTAGPVSLGNATLKLTGNGFTPNPGAVVTLIANQSSTAPSPGFANLAEGTQVTVGGFTGFITYAGNGGRDVTLVAGGPIAFSGGVNGTNFVVRRSGNNVQVLENGTIVDSRPLAAVTSLTINGTNGMPNSLTIDFGFGGYFTLSGPVTFNGGTGGTDALSVTGGTLTTSTVTYSGANAGTLGLFDGQPGSLQVPFNHTTSLDELGTTTGNLTFQLPGTAAAVTLTDNGDAASSTLNGATSFVPTTYKDPTALLVLTAGPANDALTLKRTATTNADYVLDGGGGSDSVTIDLSSETAADVVYMTANAVHSNNLDGGLHAIYFRDTGGTLGGSVALRLGSGGNRLFVQGTQSFAPTAVDPGTGTNTIVVSSNPDPTRGLLNTFASPLTLTARGGSNLLLVSEAASQTSDTVWLNTAGLAFDSEKFTLFLNAVAGGSFSGVQAAVGQGNTTVNVSGQPAAAPTSVYDNGGADVFNVAVSNLSRYANLLLDGSQSATLKVFDQTGGGTVKRHLTTGGAGNIEVDYATGGNSTIGFQNMPQQFSNDPINDV